MTNKKAKTIFNSLYNRTFKEAYGYILAKTGDFINAPVILRESYADFLTYLLTQKQSSDDHRAVLFSIIREYLKEYFSQQPHSPVIVDDNIDINLYAEYTNQQLETEIDGLYDTESKNKTIEKILDFVAKQPLAERRAFVLKYLFEFSIEQIAKELSLSEEKICNLIYQMTLSVRKELRNNMSEIRRDDE